ncbi:MAG: class I adenylate-forming enzyme family protein [Solirubrobacterales bacterium]
MSAARTPQTLVAWIAAVARAQSSWPAVIGDGVVWTYGELWERAGNISQHLTKDLGLAQGDRVALLGANEPAYLAAYFGIMRAGCVVVPINAMLDAGATREQLALVEASGLIAGKVDGEVRETIAEELPVWSLDKLPAGRSGYLPRLGPSSPACILLTSGSTGRPKGVVHSQGTLLHAALQMAAGLPFGPRDRNVAFLPFYASVPEQVLPTLCTGGALDVLPGFDAERVARAAREATALNAVPTVMARLLDQAPHEDLAGLHWVSFASEPMPVSLLERWWDALPDVETHQFYGMTELLTITAASDRLLRQVPSSVGVPFPSSGLIAIDEKGGEILDGGAGELACKSPSKMLGYLGDPEATASARMPDGAMRTGDIGRFDEDGRVYLTGRLKDLIISGGLNIAPAEIEAVACRHPAVTTAAVVGIPDERWGETPVVVVVPANGSELDATAILEHCRRDLASFKRPSGAAVVEELPSTGIGKSAKAVIRQQILDGEIELVRAN